MLDDAVLDEHQVADAARRLLAAERDHQPIRQLSLQYPDMTIEDAYRVQRALTAAKLAEGRTVKARKIGLTSRAMQQAVSITEPDYGVIFDDMFFDDGGVVPFARFIRPRVEVELAFILDQPLKGPGRDHARRARRDPVGHAGARDPRRPGPDERPRDRPPAHHRRHDLRQRGRRRHRRRRPARSARTRVDLRRVGAALYVNEAIEETGLAAGVLDHPANGVAWLANKLAPYDEYLAAGPGHPGRLVHPAGLRRRGRHRARGLRRPRER